MLALQVSYFVSLGTWHLSPFWLLSLSELQLCLHLITKIPAIFTIEVSKNKKDEIINSTNIYHIPVTLFETGEIAVTKVDKNTCHREAYILLKENRQYLHEQIRK